MTFDQIEDARENLRRGGDGKPGLSLQQAARVVGLPFEQCPECKGNGWTKATLLVSPKAMQAMAEACPTDPIPIQYDKCVRCDGAGGWIKS